MKKSLQLKQIVLALMLTIPFLGNAQRLLTENFEYTEGNLVGNGGWTQIMSTSTNPLQVTENGLTHNSYPTKNTGGAVTFLPYGQDAYLPLGKTITSGDIYVSALVNLSAVQRGNVFLTFAGEDPMTSNLRGKLFAKASESGKVQLGVARQATSATSTTGNCAQFSATELELNTTVLVVMKYSFIDGEKNDIASLYINPDPAAAEPEQADAVSEAAGLGSADATEISSIAIYQLDAKSTTGSGPSGTIDAIRVSTTWAGLFDNSVTIPDPSISFSPSYAYIRPNNGAYYFFPGDEASYTLNVKAANLKGDINVKIKNEAFGMLTTETTVIPQAAAESDKGFDLLLSLNVGDEFVYGDTITFTTEGIDPVDVSIAWDMVVPIKATNIADFRSQYAAMDEYEAAWAMFQITGEVLVNHTYMDGNRQMLYIEDETGGLFVNDKLSGYLTTPYTAGDKLSDIIFNGESSFGTMSILPAKDFGAPLSQGNKITITELTLAELAEQAARYEGCLVKVNDVTFTPNETGIFGDAGIVYINQNSDKATLKILSGADFIGETIPGTAKSIIGISTSSAGNAIAPRSISDIDADFGSGDNPGGNEPGNEVETGENLFLDPSFEAGRSNILGYLFDDWEVANASLESTITLNGNAVKITGAGTAKINQEIPASQHTFTTGEAYRLTLNYHVTKSQGGNDIQLNCSWSGIDVEETGTDILTQGFTGALNTWEKKTVRIVVPNGRQFRFNFGLKVPKGAEVIFDDFSLYKLQTIATGIGTTEENMLTAWSENGVLFIESGQAQTIDVYALNGTLINRTNLTAGVNAISLPAGAYIVKAGAETMKVINN